jgi:signal transduction histidine kinase
MNILNNAKDALVQNDEIKNKYIFIDINFDENDVIVDICDNAGGINEDIIEKVFEPYFTTKHKSIGTGIGLYMAEEIITKHMNGALFVCNKKYSYNDIEYEGASFSIKIPLYKD